MSDQKLPQKMKKKANLKEEDKEKCEDYYSEVKNFVEKNITTMTKKLEELTYFCEYNKEKNIFIGNEYNQILESYGYYNKNKKKMYLSVEEAFYLNQVGLIGFKPEFIFDDLNIVNLYLYSYLRRGGKIPIVCKILLLIEENINENKIEDKDNKEKDRDKDNEKKCEEKEKDLKKKNNNKIEDIEKYFILFENIDDYKRHKIKSILYQHNSEDNLNYLLFQKIINDSKEIYNLYKKVNKLKMDEFKSEIIICITQGITITFLKLDDTVKI